MFEEIKLTSPKLMQFFVHLILFFFCKGEIVAWHVNMNFPIDLETFSYCLTRNSLMIQDMYLFSFANHKISCRCLSSSLGFQVHLLGFSGDSIGKDLKANQKYRRD